MLERCLIIDFFPIYRMVWLDIDSYMRKNSGYF